MYYYCYHARNQDETSSFLRWILGQLSKQADAVPDHIYKNYRNGLEPTISQLLGAIKDILQSFDAVFISLDAIDESQPRESLLEVLRSLVSDEGFSKIQLLATSREYADIERIMQSISTQISMANPLLRDDIRRHVGRVLSEERPFMDWASALQEEAQKALITGAEGRTALLKSTTELFCVFCSTSYGRGIWAKLSITMTLTIATGNPSPHYCWA